MPHGRSPKLAAFVAFAGPLDLLTRFARRSSRIKMRRIDLVTGVADNDMPRPGQTPFLDMKALGQAQQRALIVRVAPDDMSRLSAMGAGEGDLGFGHCDSPLLRGSPP